MTKSKATESSFGQMVEVTKETGSMGSNMAREYTSQVKEWRNTENGRKGRESDGLVEEKESNDH